MGVHAKWFDGAKCRVDRMREHRFEKRRSVVDSMGEGIDEQLVRIEHEALFGLPGAIGAQPVVGAFSQSLDGSPVHSRIDVRERDSTLYAVFEKTQLNFFCAWGGNRIGSDACRVDGEARCGWWRRNGHENIVSDFRCWTCF